MKLLRFSLLFFAFAVLLSGAFAETPIWETGEYKAFDQYALAVYHCNETTGTDVSDATGNYDATASNALIWDTGGKWGGGCGMDGSYYFSQDTLMDLNYEKWTIEFWFKPAYTYESGAGEVWPFFDKLHAGSQLMNMATIAATGVIRYTHWGAEGGSLYMETTTNSWTSGTWYHVSVEYDGTNLELRVNGVLEDTQAAPTTAKGTLTNFFVGTESTATSIVDGVMDEFAISTIDRNSTLWLNAPDLNFVSVDGNPFDKSAYEFSYSIDGNISIDFNVFDSVNDRLAVDINFTSLALQGDGTKMLVDVNLDSTYCVDQDWDDVPSLCSVDLNIHRSLIADGNYLVSALLRNSLVDFYAWGDANITVANDVNMNIKVPIDEVTNATIDTTVTSFIVKILQGGTLSTYSGQVDQNFFSIPLGTGETIVVQIDTNRTDLYNGRIYSYLFETTQANVVLQPYLPPVANSVLTTIHTLSAVNLNPLAGLRVKVFKDLVGGRTIVHDSMTDGKGETVIPFVIADEYELEVYDGSTLLTTKDYTATSTTNNLYFYISDEGAIVIPEFANVSVNFLPAIRTHSTRDVNVSVVVASNTLSISAIQVIAVNNDVNIYDSGMDVSTPTDGNTYIIEFNNLDTMDGNYPVEFVVIVRLENGEEFYFNDEGYWFGKDPNNLITLLTSGMRTDFGCNSTNLGVTCEPLLFIALFIILFAVAGIGLTTFRNGIGLTILLLILAGAFTYIAWIPLWIYVIMFIAGMGAMLSMSRMD